jgi:hypothetical protein
MGISTDSVAQGRTFCSGNTLAPTYNTVVRVCEFAALPARERRHWTVLGPQHHIADYATAQYVLFRSGRSLSSLPLDVFAATHHNSCKDMIDSYAYR